MRFDVHRPRDLEEARSLARRLPGSRFVAGGTDLLIRLKAGAVKAPALICLRSIPELRGIELQDGGATIGAATPIAELLRHPGLAEHFPVLVEACSQLGSVQIRNAATLGGNLCNASPCADTALPGLVHGARARDLGAGGLREIPLRELFLGPRVNALAPDEVLVALCFDPVAPGSTGAFEKWTRVAMDISLVSVAVHLEWEGSRCVLARAAAGSAAPTPVRLTHTEQALRGELTEVRIAQARGVAAQDIQPVDDIRASAWYRRHMVGVLVQRAVERAIARRAS